MILIRIDIGTIVFLAEVDFFENISVVEIVGFWCCSCDGGHQGGSLKCYLL
jgi:hypothetical protein